MLLTLVATLTPIFRFGDYSSVYNSIIHTLKTYTAIFKKDKLYPADNFFHVYDYQLVENVDSKSKFLQDEYQNGRIYGVDGNQLDMWCGYSKQTVIFPGLGWTHQEVVALLEGLD